MTRTNQAPLKTARWQAVRAFVAHRASFRCEHCHQFLGMAGDVDHIVPRAEIDQCGIGVFDPMNCQYLCPSCHSSKSGRERAAARGGGHGKGPRLPRRTNLPGRDDFLNAAGIPEPEKIRKANA